MSDPTADDIRSIEIGTVLVTAAGDGLWSDRTKRTIPMTIVATVEGDIDRSADGAIEYAYFVFEARYPEGKWQEDSAGIPYTDSGVVAAVNEFLAAKGYQGSVGWSERGRQEPGCADFDADYALIDQLWPELAPPASPSP